MAATHKRYPPKTDFSDQTITNVQTIQLKEIVSDDETSVSLNLGTDAGDDFKVATDKLAVKGDTGNVGIGDGSPGTQLQMSGSEPYVTLKNSTSENGAGGCESKIIFEDHGDNALGQIEVSHVGSSDDEKGQLIIKTNNDTALTTALTINDTQQVTIPGDVVFDNRDNAGKDMTWDISEDSLILNDDVQLSCGTDRDLRLYHTGTHAYMNVVTGDLNIRTNGSESAIVCTSNAGVATYYDSAKKTETTSTGITVTGTLVADNLDIGTDVDVDGTLEADAITIGGAGIGTIYSPIAGSSSIVTTGTVGTGTWQGTAVASAYLDAQTAHLDTTQTFSGAKTFSAASTHATATLAEAKSLSISAPALATTDHTSAGVTAVMLAGAAIAAFEVVCISTTSGKIVKTDANAIGTMPVVGIATEAFSGDNETGAVLLQGFIRDDTWNWVPGSILYASETEGAMTHTAPTTSGAFVQALGVALTADVVKFMPSLTLVEVA